MQNASLANVTIRASIYWCFDVLVNAFTVKSFFGSIEIIYQFFCNNLYIFMEQSSMAAVANEYATVLGAMAELSKSIFFIPMVLFLSLS